MNSKTYAVLSNLCFALGFVSIIASIVAYNYEKSVDDVTIAQAERFGIFIGLWAPTFFALSNCLRRLSYGSAGEPA